MGSSSHIQNCADTTLVRDTITEKNDKRNQNESNILLAGYINEDIKSAIVKKYPDFFAYD